MMKAAIIAASLVSMPIGLLFFGLFLKLGLDVAYDDFGPMFTALGGAVSLVGLLSIAYWLNIQARR